MKLLAIRQSHQMDSRHPTPTILSRRGLTLIELMVAVVLTLVIVAAMIRAFKVSSDEISLGRASMDMHNQLRSVADNLRSDLQNVTCSPRPRGIADERSGYFEYIEGADKDSTQDIIDRTPPFTPPGSLITVSLNDTQDRDMDGVIDIKPYGFLGDVDDVLAMTVRSNERPFRGRFNGSYVESYVAEVVWWIAYQDDGTGDIDKNSSGDVNYGDHLQLFRRVLLIRPDLTTTETDFDTFYADNDVSVRSDSGSLVMNSLEDLSDRKNRFMHNANTFPHELIPALLTSRRLTGDAEGEDVMLSWVTDFDVKVFSPDTTVKVADNETVELTDPGYASVTTSEETTGGYVDLGNANGGWFSGTAFSKGSYSWSNFPNTYCTWTAAYESDGIDTDGDGDVDQGVDGLDNDGVNGIDDNGERETRPPYPYPIRSIQVSIRMIENNTNQVLQKTIKESFVPN